MEQMLPNPTDKLLTRRELEALVVDNPELEQLEALLGQFNIFEALGAVRQELRHSALLAFLLDPRQSHGWGDLFLKRLLQRVLAAESPANYPFTPLDLDLWNLAGATVQTEWRDIDIILLDDQHHIAVIIENKIFTTEHSQQLERYRQIVAQHYPDYSRIGLYLTPGGDVPSDAFYIPVDYGTVCNLLESLLANRAATLGADVLILIRHYTQMLRRHIVNESEIADLCRSIYRKHRAALDQIYEYRFDQQSALQEFVQTLIREHPDLAPDQSSKTQIRFADQCWDPAWLMTGKGWTRSGRLLLFEFRNDPMSLTLRLYLGPGDLNNRQMLLALAQQHQPPFKVFHKNLRRSWNALYSRRFLSPADYEDTTDDVVQEKILQQWKHFISHDLQQIRDVLTNASRVDSPSSKQ